MESDFRKVVDRGRELAKKHTPTFAHYLEFAMEELSTAITRILESPQNRERPMKDVVGDVFALHSADMAKAAAFYAKILYMGSLVLKETIHTPHKETRDAFMALIDSELESIGLQVEGKR